jgi:hydrogenase nickel incorporation protein HypA/HybF
MRWASCKRRSKWRSTKPGAPVQAVCALSGVVPEALELAFAAASPGTPAEGAEFEFEEVPVVCRCDECGKEFQPTDIVYCCPHCDALSSSVCQGRELELSSLEVS